MPESNIMEKRKMPESDIIDKLMRMPTYSGVIDINSDVIPLWDIGINKVSFKLFLESSKEYYKRKEKKGLLYIPINIPFNLPDYDGKLRKLLMKR